MSFLASAVAASAVAGLGGAYMQSQAAKTASNQQVQLGQQALGQQNALFQQGLGLNQPFINMGQSAGSTLQGLLTPGPNQTNILSQLPGFQFAQDWGQKATQNLGTTTGLGGNVLKAGADYATGVAQQGFGTYAGLLQQLTNTGASSAQSAFGNATQTGTSMANTATGIGNSMAAGTLGSANALAGGLTGAGNAGITGLLLSKLTQGNTGGAAGGGNFGMYSGNPINETAGSTTNVIG